MSLALWIPNIDMERGPAERGSIRVTLGSHRKT